MKDLIPIINRLQNALSSMNQSTVLDLPQIAVVGGQSTGKSSVLESIVGKDFLPRGNGIVTRRPLLLQLIHIKNGTLEWGEFNHSPNVKFEDFSEIRREIERETERITGRNKIISPHPIGLKIFSPNVIDLTLIDLPGITKIPVGDQPPDIEHQIRDMILTYIAKPSCIILAVTAANTDLANSDALKVAMEVDPKGDRTVGVLTKMDLMDPGTDAVDMLCGKVFPLRLGYVGVVCRSQKDIQSRKALKEALKTEERFFREHPSYKKMSSHMGTPHLAKMLNSMLMHHIRDSLPDLRAKLSNLIYEYSLELSAYGDPAGSPNPEGLLVDYCSRFARTYQDMIEGKVSFEPHTPGRLQGGARLFYLFHEVFGKNLTNFDPLSGLPDAEIRTTIRNSTGPQGSLFVPEGAFELLVRKQIRKMEAPALQCVDQVYEELQSILEQCELPEMQRYPVIREKFNEVASDTLKHSLQPTNIMINNLFQIELAYLNINHPDFVGGRSAFMNVPASTQDINEEFSTLSVSSNIPDQNASDVGQRTLFSILLFNDLILWQKNKLRRACAQCNQLTILVFLVFGTRNLLLKPHKIQPH
eukprot:GHVL01039825.1.p1 GENE.GHVL01039825.1~~GHVL01039825.1.p1  ORF type:complete len:586 (+),score=61.10 GHVL01039825.1:47-1804(+)